MTKSNNELDTRTDDALLGKALGNTISEDATRYLSACMQALKFLHRPVSIQVHHSPETPGVDHELSIDLCTCYGERVVYKSVGISRAGAWKSMWGKLKVPVFAHTYGAVAPNSVERLQADEERMTSVMKHTDRSTGGTPTRE